MCHDLLCRSSGKRQNRQQGGLRRLGRASRWSRRYPLLGDPAAHRFGAELAEGRWQDFHDFLECTRDWDERNWYVATLSSRFSADRPEWLEQWKAAKPMSSLPLLFSGTHLKDWAWHARGPKRARYVAQDAWPVFRARLADADRELARAAERDEHDPTPYAQSIWTALRLSLGLDERMSRFAQVASRHRWHMGAHHAMIQALARKWRGSNEAMFEFARSESAQASGGHSVHRIIALAHIEGYIDLPVTAEDGSKPRQGYFQRPEVRAEVYQAAEQSVRSPAYVPWRQTPADRNTFAFCFHLMHDYHAQLQQMNLIGDHITRNPWNQIGKPGQTWERARAIALAQIAKNAPARMAGSSSDARGGQDGADAARHQLREICISLGVDADRQGRIQA